MTTRDYEKFAALFSAELTTAQNLPDTPAFRKVRKACIQQVRNIILSSADLFKQDNSNFRRDQFYVACGLAQDGELL